MENTYGNSDNMRGIEDQNSKSLSKEIACLFFAAVMIFADRFAFIAGGEEKLSVTQWVITKDLAVISYIWRAVGAVLLCAAASMLIRRVLSAIYKKTGSDKARKKTVLTVMYSAASYIFVIVGFILVLVSFNVDIVGIGATIGILTIVLGFGAQELIADVFAGMCMLFENQFNIGDIIVADEFRGTVEKIGFRTTMVRDIGGNIKIFNNSDLRDIINCSAQSSKAVCDVGIGYNTDIETAERAVNEAIARLKAEYPQMFNDIQYWGVESLSDYAIILRIVGETGEDDIYDARRIINRAVLVALKANGVVIPTVDVQDHDDER